MGLSVWFWVIFVISVIFSFYSEYSPAIPWFRGARHFVIYLLLFILGMQVFGGPVK